MTIHLADETTNRLDPARKDALTVQGLTSGYGSASVLNGVDLTVPEGSVTAILGRNGAGKTTLVHTIMGVVKPRTGSVSIGTRDVTGCSPHRIARAGVALVPQGRRMFPSLTVTETLTLVRRRGGDWSMERLFELFPRLAERRSVRSGDLSGGEQQMLSIARALAAEPNLLLLDEPSDGLARSVIDQIQGALSRLREEGLTIVLVEQDLRTAFALADDVHVLSRGAIVHSSGVAAFSEDGELAKTLLGVG